MVISVYLNILKKVKILYKYKLINRFDESQTAVAYTEDISKSHIIADNLLLEIDKNTCLNKYIWVDNTDEINTNIFKENQIAILETDYKTAITELQSALAVAQLRNDTALIADIQFDFAELQTAYQKQKEAIENGIDDTEAM